MHSCPKKTSEAMFDWVATTALKTLINTILSTFTDIQEFSLGCLFCFTKTTSTASGFEKLLAEEQATRSDMPPVK